MEKQFFEIVKYILWAVFGSGLVLEIVPIKINPLSAIVEWIGTRLNKKVEDKIDKVNQKVDTLQTDLQDHKVETWRRDILDFADRLMRNEKKSKEDFNNIISLHDKYYKYIEDRGLENGQVSLSFSYISEKYKECLENNDFL